MNWQRAIGKNRKALAAVVADLLAKVRQQLPLFSLEGEIVGARQAIPRPLYRAILRILRPAESALRRLIVIVAAMLQARAGNKATNENAAKSPLPDFSSFTRHETLPAFPLIDPRKSLGGMARSFSFGTPRISVPGSFDAARPTRPDQSLDTTALLRRIRKLQYALHDLPRQARRLNRLMARRAKAPPGPGRVGPIRPGHPPGHRKKPRHEADEVLRECHMLVRDLQQKPP